MRRSAGALLLAGFAASAACGRSDRLLSRKAPVVLISVDTLRADHLPAYGYAAVATPHIDALRKDAVLFRNAYAHVPLTLGSHATLLTGLLPPQNGIRDNLGFSLRPDIPTLASILSDGGYAAGGAVSAEVLGRASGISRGFTFWDDAVEENGRFEREGGRTAQALLGWMAAQHDRPVFAFLHLFEPHAPYEPPEPFKSRYALAYDGEIAAADAIVGAFLDRLKALGLYDRALIVFLSDHGEGLGDHGEKEHGVLLYREALHVPLLVKLPGGLRAGETDEAPAALTDVLPTVVNRVGVALPTGLAGRDLFGGLRAPRRLYAETMYPRLRLGWSDLASLLDERYQYIEAPRPELYDIAADPGEKTDLAKALPPAFRAMRAELAAMPRPFEMPGAADPERAKKLMSLGYLSATSPLAQASGLPDPKEQIDLLDAYHGFQELLARKDDARLIPACRAFLARVPAALDIWRMLADAIDRAGRHGEAIAVLKKGLQASSGTALPAVRAPALERLALLLVRAGRLEEALELGESDSLTDTAALNAIGVAQARAGRAAEARKAFERALVLSPENAEAHFNLGTALMDTGDATKAKEHFEQSVRLEPKNAAAWSSLGQARVQLGDEGGAIEGWKRALELDGSQYGALYNLAIAEGRRGDAGGAREKLRRFVANAPASVYARDLSEARRLLKAMGS